ncbi:SOS response-associated peptidase [Clostridia bacterium]|nr:SOS response-associated peptidase [Clostridia bacterium]
MCGRVSLSMEWNRLSFILGNDFNMEEIPEKLNYKPRYNIAPGYKLPCIITNPKSGKQRVGLMKWNYTPFVRKSQTKDRAFTLINARAETIDSKPSFVHSFLNNPCIIPVEGFYEWEKKDKEKIPHLFKPKNDKLLYLAAIYTPLPDSMVAAGANPYGFLIITTKGNDLMLPIHERMPALLTADLASSWLDLTKDPVERKSLLRPASENLLVHYRVDPAVNSTQAEGIACTKPID